MQTCKFLLITLCATFCASCANPQVAQSSSDLKAAADKAIRAQVECAHRSLATVDDGFSDAQSVALAVASVCAREYNEATEAFGLYTLDNDRQRRMFRERRASAQFKIESFLPYVMSWRAENRKN